MSYRISRYTLVANIFLSGVKNAGILSRYAVRILYDHRRLCLSSQCKIILLCQLKTEIYSIQNTSILRHNLWFNKSNNKNSFSLVTYEVNDKL